MLEIISLSEHMLHFLVLCVYAMSNAIACVIVSDFV